MKERILKFFLSFFPKWKSDNALETIPDAHWEKEIAERNRRLAEAEKVVGTSPLDHIDFINKHGMDEFNKVYFEKEETKPESEVGIHTIDTEEEPKIEVEVAYTRNAGIVVDQNGNFKYLDGRLYQTRTWVEDGEIHRQLVEVHEDPYGRRESHDPVKERIHNILTTRVSRR